jgi:hypothetical protein
MITLVEILGVVYAFGVSISFGAFALDESKSQTPKYHTVFVGAILWPFFVFRVLVYKTTGYVLLESVSRRLLGLNT